MDNRYRLGGLENDRLLESLRALVRRENESLSDMLAHLAELDELELCLELGYSSLFNYCIEALGFSKSAAGRRIAAARVCRTYPEAFARVASGELELSVLCALNKYLNTENAAELFEACRRKSCEQVELLLAARFPRPDVRDLVRRLPAQVMTEGTPDIGSTVPGGTVKPLSAERFSVNFTADSEFRELLEEVRALISHSEPKGDLMTVMKRGLKSLRAELLKKRFGVGRKPRRVRPSADGGMGLRTRYVTAEVSRAVWERDGGRCTFCSAEGRHRSERRLLQLDHVQPFALGGESTVGNLRLRCRAHNLRAANVQFGRKFMRAARSRKRAGRSGSNRRSHPHRVLACGGGRLDSFAQNARTEHAPRAYAAQLCAALLPRKIFLAALAAWRFELPPVRSRSSFGCFR